jgi:hypothetical protein
MPDYHIDTYQAAQQAAVLWIDRENRTAFRKKEYVQQKRDAQLHSLMILEHL